MRQAARRRAQEGIKNQTDTPRAVAGDRTLPEWLAYVLRMFPGACAADRGWEAPRGNRGSPSNAVDADAASFPRKPDRRSPRPSSLGSDGGPRRILGSVLRSPDATVPDPTTTRPKASPNMTYVPVRNGSRGKRSHAASQREQARRVSCGSPTILASPPFGASPPPDTFSDDGRLNDNPAEWRRV